MNISLFRSVFFSRSHNMKFSLKWAGIPALALGLMIGTAQQAEAALLTNGDFETGDFTGWTKSSATTVIDATTPLAGTASVVQTGGNGLLRQAFTAQTTPTTASFIFTATDPGGAADRTMNVYFEQSGSSSNRVNLRLVDRDDDGDGDVEVFDGAWQLALENAVTFGEVTSLSLTFNSYGVGANYDLTVGSSTATGLTAFQNGAPTDFGDIIFVSSSNSATATFEFDNVVVPEPSTFLLAVFGGLGLTLLRRRRK